MTLPSVNAIRELYTIVTSIHHAFQFSYQFVTEKQDDLTALCVNACALCLFTSLRGSPLTGISLIATSVGALLIEKKIYAYTSQYFQKSPVSAKSQTEHPLSPTLEKPSEDIPNPQLFEQIVKELELDEKEKGEFLKKVKAAQNKYNCSFESAVISLKNSIQIEKWEKEHPPVYDPKHIKEREELEAFIEEESQPGGFFYTGE